MSTSAVKKAKTTSGASILKDVTFGPVTVRVTLPSEKVLRANVEAGQAALRRSRSVLATPGVKIEKTKDVPLYFGCEDRPGFMVQELNGKKTTGRFVRGSFVPEVNMVVVKRKPKTAATK